MYYLLTSEKKPYEVTIEEMIKNLHKHEMSVVKDDTLDDQSNVRTIFTFFSRDTYDNKPFLFETKIVGGEHDGYIDKYFTYEDAVDGHSRCLEMVNKK